MNTNLVLSNFSKSFNISSNSLNTDNYNLTNKNTSKNKKTNKNLKTKKIIKKCKIIILIILIYAHHQTRQNINRFQDTKNGLSFGTIA